MEPVYLTIRQEETGRRIKMLLAENGYSVRDIQSAMGFENPQAVYKWTSGKSLPSLDNLLILSKLLNTSIEEILVIDGDFDLYGHRSHTLNLWFNDRRYIRIYSLDTVKNSRNFYETEITILKLLH